MNWGTALAATCAATLALVLPAAASADIGFAGQWGTAGTGNGQFQVPQGVAADGAGNVYVADGNGNRVEKFDAGGNFLLAFGGSGSGAGAFNGPGHIGLDPQGNVLVADEGNYRIEKFSPTGTFLLQYGRFGQNPGQFRGNPRGVAADPAGNVYVVDTGVGGKVDKFAPDGTFVAAWGTAGSAPGQWNAPRGIASDSAGNLYVGDTGNHEIDVYKGDGTFVRSFGAGGQGPAALGYPNQTAIDSKGNVFVGDNAPGGIVEYSPAGEFIGRTSATDAAGTDRFRPNGIAVGIGDDVFTDDVGLSRVLRFHQGPPAPVLGKTASVTAVTGTVKIKLPGTSTFKTLTADTSFPVRSTLDTTRGSVALALSKGGGATQTGSFKGGQFQLTQKASGSEKGLAELRLAGGGNFKSCKTAKAARRRPSRQLFASVHGRFRTRGRNSAATVRGTKWLTKDTCAGTLTRVMRGVVLVRDFNLRKTVRLTKGKRYLARPKSLRKHG